MTERRTYRPRKVVDYSKFALQDSDDDDFSDSRPSCKKTKSSSNSSNKSHSESKSRLNLSKHRSVENEDTSISNVSTSFGHFSDKENVMTAFNGVESKVIVFTNKNKMAPGTEEAKVEENEIIAERLLNTRSGNDPKVGDVNKTGCDEIMGDNGPAEHENTDDSTEIVPVNRSKSLCCQNKPSAINVAACNLLTTVNVLTIENNEGNTVKSFHSLAPEKSQLTTKWKAPGPASTSALQRANDLTRESTSKSNKCLRIGLSRNIRVKPLHSNVKVQP